MRGPALEASSSLRDEFWSSISSRLPVIAAVPSVRRRLDREWREAYQFGGDGEAMKHVLEILAWLLVCQEGLLGIGIVGWHILGGPTMSFIVLVALMCFSPLLGFVFILIRCSIREEVRRFQMVMFKLSGLLAVFLDLALLLTLVALMR